MESLVHSLYGKELTSIFGYSSKSVPGLEINGIGKFGKAIKEKIVYITRDRQLQIPLKRYVINVELPDTVNEDLTSEKVKWLELGILFQYWQLAGVIPEQKNILAVGSVTPSGVVSTHPEGQFILNLGNQFALSLVGTHHFPCVERFKVDYDLDVPVREEPETLPAKFINPTVIKCRREDYNLLTQHIANLRLLISHAEKKAAEKGEGKLYDVEVSCFLETF